MLFAALAGFILVVVLLLAGYVWRRARQLAARARLFAADPIEPRSTFATVSVLPARHLVTREAGREEDARLPGFPAGSEGALGVTDREVVLAAGPATLLSLPTARISEPVLLSRFRTHVADDSQGILRVRWERGGVGLETLFLVQGRRHLVERLRRDIHLRAGRAARLWVPPAWRGATQPKRNRR